ncbi:MAG TPA: hypothetical protein VMJ66_03150 [Geobacteraceae bacterium]|nr:hypothetical protein [Geobacteraceae bacterium]
MAFTLVLPAGGNALAKGKARQDPPDMEMLEYLGSYETAGGGMIDPLDIPAHAHPRKEKTSASAPAPTPVPKGAPAGKPDRTRKEESND